MRNLLDSSSLRRLKFIEYMLEENRWCKTEQIADRLGCSESTVKSDIKYFHLYFASDFKFETSKQKGVRLIISNTFRMDSFYQKILCDCLNVQFLNLLFYNSFHTLEEYSEELYTSVSSVKRCIEQVKPVLEKFELTIQQKPIRVQGREERILLFYRILFWEEYGTSFLNLHFNYINEAYEMITTFKRENDLALSSTLLNKTILWLVLVLERFSIDNHIENDFKPFLPVSKEIEKFVSKEMNKLPFKIKKEDIQYISYFLESRYIYFAKEVIETNPKFKKVFNDIEVFLNTLSKRTSLPLKNMAVVQKRLFSHYLYKLEMRGLNYSLVESNRMIIYNQEGMYDELLETAVNTLESLDKAEWSEAVLKAPVDFLYILIITWENLTTEILKHGEKVNILIMSQFGLYYERYLEELLNLHFSYRLNTFLLTKNNYPDSIELIITDHETTEMELQLDNSIPVAEIKYSVNHKSWDRVNTLINEIYLKKINNQKKNNL